MRAMGPHSLASVLAVVVNVGWHVARVVVVLGFLLLIIGPFVDPPRIEVEVGVPVAFTLAPDTHRVTPATSGIEQARIGDLEGWIYFSPRSPGVVMVGAIGIIAFAALAVWILGNLKGVFATLRQGRPFVPGNATRIRRIAWGLICVEIAGAILSYAGSVDAIRHFSTQGLTLHTRIDFDPITIIAALIMFVIAEVFREGSRLDEEQSLTV